MIVADAEARGCILLDAAEAFDQPDQPGAPQAGSAQRGQPVSASVYVHPRSCAARRPGVRAETLQSIVRMAEHVVLLDHPVGLHHHAVADVVEGPENHHQAVVNLG